MKTVQTCILTACFEGALYMTALSRAEDVSTAVITTAVDYVRDVQPILAARCYACHGADAQEGELRLDSRDDALRGGTHHDAIVPGNSDRSRLIDYVSSRGETGMPKEGEPLTQTQIALLRTWINQGATWPSSIDSKQKTGGHWSLQPIQRPQLPSITDRSWIRNEIDAFVLAKLNAAGIAPSPEVNRSTLLRRLCLDLLGLPPTPEETAAFLADRNADAYERLLDRLLASPHFGERWARHWLDRARFAETSGCVIDLERPYQWRWRDWVIRSMNSDQPFDQFTIDQIAGDLITGATLEQKVATGFHRNALSNHEGGVDLELERIKTAIDRTNAVGSAWLGLTVGCAECHSHKFDPISQEDYYRMFAFFNSMEDREIDAALLGEPEKLAACRQNLGTQQLQYLATAAEGQAKWEQSVAGLPDIWTVPRDFDASTFRSRHHADVNVLPDGSLVASGRFDEDDKYLVTFPIPLEGVTAIRIEALPDRDRANRGPGRGENSQFILTGWVVKAAWPDAPNDFKQITFSGAVADYCQSGFNVDEVLDDKEETGWAGDHPGLPHVAIFVPANPAATRGAARLAVQLLHDRDRGRQFGRFRVSITTAPDVDASKHKIPADILAIIHRTSTQRTADEAAVLKRYYQTIFQPDDSELKLWNAALDYFAKATGEWAAHVVKQRPTARPTFVHIRGDYRRPGKQVEPGTLRMTSAEQSTGAQTRLDLARWLVDRSNPLTARVAVNDIWQHLFGAGLVRTSEDFGKQGEPPTHPELLDWLADEFATTGWSRKSLIRRIVCSSIYRQSSLMRDDLLQSDPKNLLLARQNRFRLEAEIIRDVSLATANLLDRRIGGASYKPITEEPDDWSCRRPPQSSADRLRRGMYVFVMRTLPDPALGVFDLPDALSVCTRRARTNTPLQALTTLNEPVFVEAAASLARQLATDDRHTVQEKIANTFAQCLTRPPSVAEAKLIEELYSTTLAEFQANLKKAQELSKANSQGNDQPEFCSWFVVARTLLNTEEMLTRE